MLSPRNTSYKSVFSHKSGICIGYTVHKESQYLTVSTLFLYKHLGNHNHQLRNLTYIISTRPKNSPTINSDLVTHPS